MRAMTLEHLSDAFPGESPVGRDCIEDIESQNLALMMEYLVERANQKTRERGAEQPGQDPGEARNAAAVREEGKRRLVALEGILKDLLKVSSVSIEQVSKNLRDRSSVLLSEKGKDLRLMPFLAAAHSCIDGLSGYSGVLDLATRLLQSYPSTLYPVPDDESEEAWERANAVAEMVSSSGMHTLLDQVVVIDGRQAGRFWLADIIGSSSREISIPEVSASILSSSLQEIGPQRSQLLLATLRDTATRIRSLEGMFKAGTLVSSTHARRFERASSRVASLVDPERPKLASDQAEAGTDIVTTPITVTNPAAASFTLGDLRSREDARRTIQNVISFIERLEPGHPSPLLLKRADRLLGMDFRDIIKDMAPDALKDIELIAGKAPSA